MAETGPDRIYSTSEVASHLGISANTVRRYGLAWEEVQGETLPHLPGMGRLYPADVVEALEQAQAWLKSHPEREIEEALHEVLGLSAREAGPRASPPELPTVSLREAVSQAVAPLAHEIDRMSAQLARLEQGQQALLAYLADLQATDSRGKQARDLRAGDLRADVTKAADLEKGFEAEKLEARDVKPREVEPRKVASRKVEPKDAAPRTKDAAAAEEAPLEHLPRKLVVETRPEATVGPVKELHVQVEDVPFKPAAPDWTFFEQATQEPATLAEEAQAPKDPLADVWLEDETSEEEVVLEEPSLTEPQSEPKNKRGVGEKGMGEKADDKSGFIGWFKRNF